MPPRPGDRVVVRYLVPSGAATDVIGRLIDDGDPLIVERDGAEHAVPREAIVAFKTVPPRPVRASEVRSLDLARARSWWSIEREWIDGWLCRAAPGLRGNRASSAAALHPDASAAGLPAVREWFAARGLDARIEVSGPRPIVDPAPLTTVTDVLVIRSAAGAPDPEVRVSDRPDAAWLALTGVTESLIRSVDGPAHFLSIDEAGAPVAAARVTVTADAAGHLWGGLGAVTVAPDQRRRGLARRVVGHALSIAAESGADRTFLEVTHDNPTAQALYRGLGFEPHHSYGFWTVSS